MKLICKSVFCGLILVSLLLISSCKNSSVRNFEAMDTLMRVTVNGKNSEKLALACENRIKELESLLSVTDSQSDVYKMNHGQGSAVEVSEDTVTIIRKSLEVANASSGIFNPLFYPVTEAWGFTKNDYRIPSQSEINSLLELTDYSKVSIQDSFVQIEPNMKFDFGAIAKGYTGDEVIKLLKSKGIKSALLNFGGNVQALGTKPDGSVWKVGIQCPWNNEVAAALEVNNQAVITSGGYIRYFIGEDGKKYIHIFDGRTGYPAESDLLSATIVCDSGCYGDALSTTCFILGKDGAVDFWKKYKDFDMILITKDQSIYYTRNLAGKLHMMETFQNIEVIE